MTDTIKIGVEMESSDLQANAKQAARSIEGVGDAAESAGKDLKGVTREGDKAEASLHEVGKEAAKAGSELTDLSKDSGKAEKAMHGLGSEAEKSESKLQRLKNRIAQSGASMATFGGTMRSSARLAQWGSDKIVNQYTAMAGGAGMGFMIKKTMDFNAQLRQVAINAMDMNGKIDGKPLAQGMAELKKEILGVAQAAGQSPEALLAGIGRVVQFSGDLALAREQLKLASDVGLATSNDVAPILELIDTLNKSGNVKPENMRAVMNMLVAQGRSGAFDIGEFAAQGPQMLGVLSQFAGGSGVVDQRALNSFAALSNLGMSATHNAELARTSILALANDVSDINVLKQRARSAGISSKDLYSSVYSDAKHTQRRPIEEFLRRIITATGGNTEKMSVLFGEASQKIALALATSWRENDHKFAYLDQQLQAAEASSKYDVIGKAKAENLKDPKKQAEIAMQTALNVGRDFSEMVIYWVTPAIQFLNEHTELFRKAVIGVSVALMAAAGIVLGGKLKTFVQEGMAAWRGGKKGLGGVAGAAAGIPAGVTRVWVMNPGFGGLGGAGSSLPTGGASIPSGSTGRGRVGRILSRPGLAVGGLFAADILMDEGGTAMGWGKAAGAILGAEAGAKIGAFGGPIGMLIGSTIGSILGATVLPWLSENVSDYKSRKEAEQWADQTGRKDRAKSFVSDATAVGTTARDGKVASSFFGEAKVVSGASAPQFNPVFNIGVSIDSDGRVSHSIEGEKANQARLNVSHLGARWGLAN